MFLPHYVLYTNLMPPTSNGGLWWSLGSSTWESGLKSTWTNKWSQAKGSFPKLPSFRLKQTCFLLKWWKTMQHCSAVRARLKASVSLTHCCSSSPANVESGSKNKDGAWRVAVFQKSPMRRGCFYLSGFFGLKIVKLKSVNIRMHKQ